MAIEDYHEAIRVDPKNSLTYVNMSIAYGNLGEADQAKIAREYARGIIGARRLEKLWKVLKFRLVPLTVAVIAWFAFQWMWGPVSPLAKATSCSGKQADAFLAEASAGLIAFSSDLSGYREIYVMNADGTGKTRLTNNPATDGVPTWPPDGNRVAFHSDRDGNYEIYVMNADGSGQTNLTNNAADDGYPAWSPDSAKIAFGSYSDGNGEIYVMNTDGSSLTNLTNNAANDWNPDWSPE